VPFDRDETVKAASAAARVLSITDADGREKASVLYQLRADAGRLYLFMCNTDRKNGTGELTVSVRAQGQVQLWDAESGKRYSMQSRKEGEKLSFRTQMPPSGSRLFVITTDAEQLPPYPSLGEVRGVALAAEDWESRLTEPNVLVLDMARYRINGGQWQGPLEILKVDSQVRQALGLPPRGGGMVQPWARRKEAAGPSAHLELRWDFRVERVPRGPIYLAMEEPRRFAVRLNGVPVPQESECGWWVDPAIRKLPLDVALLKVGANELVVEGRFDQEADLEAAFILGEFSVRVQGRDCAITGPLGPVGFGDWTRQGLPFYGGSVVWETEAECRLGKGERLFLEVPSFAGACVRVLVDGLEAGIIGWQPHEVDITELVQGKRRVKLGVEVVSHRRNCFGPLHWKGPMPAWIGPGTFISSGQEWQDEYNLVECGCLSAPRLSYRTAR